MVRAAATPMAGMTALTSLETLGLPEGSSLLVVGASGGVGSFAVQLAAIRRLHVLAAVRGDGEDRLKKLGATEVFDMTSAPLPAQVRAARPEGVDGMLHLIPDRPSFAELSATVRAGGIAVTTTYSADPNLLAAHNLKGGNISLTPSRALLDRLAREMAGGNVVAPVEEERPLVDGPSVLARSRAGELRGKVVLVP
jgi:NADPH:quinone reductase-like Zn-dependent oxidoreductase